MTAGDRLSSTTLLALLPDRPSVPLSSLPEWTWGLTQQCKTNNTSARPSVFSSNEAAYLSVDCSPCRARLSITAASSIIPWPSPLDRHESVWKKHLYTLIPSLFLVISTCSDCLDYSGCALTSLSHHNTPPSVGLSDKTSSNLAAFGKRN